MITLNIILAILGIPLTYCAIRGINFAFKSIEEPKEKPKKETSKINKKYCKNCIHSELSKEKIDLFCSVYNKFVIWNGLNKKFNCKHYEDNNIKKRLDEINSKLNATK